MARDYRKELTAWNSPENRRKRQGEYMEKHGPQKPRRKRLWPPTGTVKGPKGKSPRGKGTKDLRDRLKEIQPRTFGSIQERLGGGVKAKPHSTKEGRTAAGKRRIKRLFSKEATRPRPRPGRPLPRPRPLPSPGGPSPSTPKWRHEERIMTPLRAKHGVGSIVKKIITKFKPKPKGVFKPKPVPKAVTDVDRPFKGYDKSYTRADDKKITSMLKKLGDEIKAAPLPPQLKKTLKKLQQAYPHKKAKGGPVRPIDIPWPKKRVKKRHGGSAQSHYLQHGYGPTKVKLRSGRPKIAKKGW
jgi:hypothetical protein